MNMWGFTNRILGELNSRFKTFLDENLKTNPLKAEFFLPDVVGDILKEDKATVRVLKSHDKWYGVTYKEDKERVVTVSYTHLDVYKRQPLHINTTGIK